MLWFDLTFEAVLSIAPLVSKMAFTSIHFKNQDTL